MTSELQNMKQKEVWNILPKTSIPAMGNAKKADGRYGASCVAKSIPEKDFQENHEPVVSDTTLNLLLAIKTAFKLSSGQFEIEAAFLYGEFGEEQWMAIPDGYAEYVKEKHNINPKTHCLKQKQHQSKASLLKAN